MKAQSPTAAVRARAPVPALRRSVPTEKRYQKLLDSAPDAIIVVNQRGEIALLNRQAEKQFGYPRAELLGQRLSRVIPGDFEARLHGDRKSTRLNSSHTIQSRMPSSA